jgi:DNA-binding IclR family transcriptional regulator
MDECFQNEILSVPELPRRTPNTITDPQLLREEIAAIRERGYATDCEESEPDTFCVAAPIFGTAGKVVAACSISGDTRAIIDDQREELAGKLLKAALQISQHLGHMPSWRQIKMVGTDDRESTGSGPEQPD